MSLVAVAAPATAHDRQERDHDESAIYRVTVENLTGGQPLTPLVLAAHRRPHAVFRPGRPASPGLQQLAENGGVPVLAQELGARDDIATVAVVGSAPIAPGGSTSGLVAIGDGDVRRVTLVGMLVCTNDGFAGAELRLPEHIGRSVSRLARAWDAGTEINTEAYADLVPPCDGMGGSGMSNPALAEGGVVHPHHGIAGIGDLDPAVHGWRGPVVRITVERVG